MYSSSGDIEIGATLRKARQDIGATLDEVEYETKIRKRYLEALEREDYGDLPGAVYARGFLKTYANYLGLDGDELSRELKDHRDAVQERQSPSSKEDRLGRGRARSPARGSARGSAGAMSNRRRRVSPLAMLGFALTFVLLAAAVGGLYWIGQNSRPAPGSPDSQSGQPPAGNEQPSNPGGATGGGLAGDQGSQNGPGPQTREGAGRTGPGEAPPPPEVVRITVTVAQVPAWLNVQTDGNTVYEQVAQPGFSQTFEAGQQVAVWTGNAGAVRLDINGQDYGALGAPGEVRRRVFTLKPAGG